MKKFKTLIIDPPWPYEAASKHEKLSGYVTQEGNEQYPTLTIEDLAALPISDVMDEKEAYIFLWTTSPFTPDALELLKVWGFQYVTTVCWYKDTGLGVGYWFRGDHELALVGKRKGAASIRSGKRSVFQSVVAEDDPLIDIVADKAIVSKRLRHSAKPDTLHRIIEERRPPYEHERKRKDKDGNEVVTMTSTPTSFPGPFLEVFARQAREGWTVLGNEAPGDEKDIRVSLPALIAKLDVSRAAVGE